MSITDGKKGGRKKPNVSQKARKADVRFSVAVQDRIVAYLVRGVSFNAMARLPNMPTRWTLAQWRKDNPEFWTITEDAIWRAKSSRLNRPPTEFSSDLAQQYCLRIAEGRVKVDICNDLDMPTSDTISLWFAQQPEFAAMLEVAREGQALNLIDETRVIADAATAESLNVAKLQIATRQFAAGKPRSRGPIGKQPTERPIINVEVVRFGHQIQDD